MPFRAAPLKTSFMVTSILGFLISVLYLYKYSVTWSFTLGLVFFIMFIASVISMSRASPDEQLSPRLKK